MTTLLLYLLLLTTPKMIFPSDVNDFKAVDVTRLDLAKSTKLSTFQLYHQLREITLPEKDDERADKKVQEVGPALGGGDQGELSHQVRQGCVLRQIQDMQNNVLKYGPQYITSYVFAICGQTKKFACQPLHLQLVYAEVYCICRSLAKWRQLRHCWKRHFQGPFSVKIINWTSSSNRFRIYSHLQ